MFSTLSSLFASSGSIIRQRTFLFFLLLKLGILAAFIIADDLGSRMFRYFACEILLLELIFLCRHRWVKGLGLLLLLAHTAHITNVFSTGLLLETETLLNYNAHVAIQKESLIKMTAAFCVWLLLWLPSVFRKGRYGGAKAVAVLAAVLTLAAVSLRGLPMRHFAEKAGQAAKILSFRAEPQSMEAFLNDGITAGKPPLSAKDCNIILIFTEGTSLRVLSDELTPNACALKRKSLVFENYFNHTAATFRGIRGQLLSGYQLRGGYYQKGDGLGQLSQQEQKKILLGGSTLPAILKRHGYSTIFLSPHRKGDPFNTFLELLDFDDVRFLHDDDHTHDKELYPQLAEAALNAHAKGQKFFLSTYVLGTHHGWDSPHIKYGNGSNPYLNKFHNQDHWLGEFLSTLEKSGILRDTLLIFTTDHATYPSVEFRKTFSSNAPYFADRIPLFIYTQGVTPQTVDARNQNSLCLAPTILDLLELRKEQNCFLGNSLFSKDIGPFSRLSNIGYDYFDSSSGEIRKFEPDRLLKEKIEKFFRIFG